MKKRLVAMFTSAMLAVSMLGTVPVNARVIAENGWSYNDETRILTITKSGVGYGIDDLNKDRWFNGEKYGRDYRKEVEKIIITETARIDSSDSDIMGRIDTFTNPALEIELTMSPEATSLPSFAFYNCKALTRIDIQTISYIPTGAFTGCTNLETVISRALTVPDIEDGAFDDTFKVKWYYPASANIISWEEKFRGNPMVELCRYSYGTDWYFINDLGQMYILSAKGLQAWDKEREDFFYYNDILKVQIRNVEKVREDAFKNCPKSIMIDYGGATILRVKDGIVMEEIPSGAVETTVSAPNPIPKANEKVSDYAAGESYAFAEATL